MRIFISIELPEDIKKNIDNLIKEFKSNLTPIKWAQSKNLHVTLKFLGNVEENKIDELARAIKGCVKEINSFKVDIGGIGAFPDTKRPRIIWVGITEGAETIKIIADKIEDTMAEEGFREEEREFTSHITIGRIKERVDIEMLEKHINNKEEVHLGSFDAEHISIMKSTLTPKGPIYEEINKIIFKK